MKKANACKNLRKSYALQNRTKIVGDSKSYGNRSRYRIVQKSYALQNRTEILFEHNRTEIVRLIKTYGNRTRD